jgi:putative DNA primase/helicase
MKHNNAALRNLSNSDDTETGNKQSTNKPEAEPVALILGPWPDEVDGAELLESIRRVHAEHLILPQYADIACSLWTLHTYVFDAFEISPRLFLRSPTRRCGKTRALRLLKKLVRKPLFTPDATPASLFEEIHRSHPTVLLDEWDSMSYANDFRNGFNCGYERDGEVRRKYGTFSTFTPLAIASNTSLHPTMEDRSIVVLLKRKKIEEKVMDSRDFDGTEIVRKCMRWAADHRLALERVRPLLPDGLDDRALDHWTPLLAIANEVGGRWPGLVRKAALALSQGRDEIGKEEQLLRDIREVFEGEHSLFTDDLLRRLTAKKDAPWAAEGLNEWSLAKLLAGFSIRPKLVRKSGAVRRGYLRSVFLDAWSRWA